MSSDVANSAVPVIPENSLELERSLQVRLKSEAGNLLVILPPEEGDAANPATQFTWSDLWQQLNQRLNSSDRFWQPNTVVHLMADDRLLDVRQLQELEEALTAAQLHLKRVFTSRRQTAVAAATAGYSVEQQALVGHLNQSPAEVGKALAEPLYLETTLRSGVEVRHQGSVVILGDLNPGSSIVAEGDILVWGRLRGIAHAGSAGNDRCAILALQMEPMLLRIAHLIARAPETPPDQYTAEVAYVIEGTIRIARAIEFQRAPR
jgi:septum site-determining protein MinC